MDSKLYTVLKRLSLGIQPRVRTHGRSEEVIAATDRTIGRLQNYHTSRPTKTSLYSMISPLGNPGISVKSELDCWIKQDKKVWVGELKRIIRDLRKRKRFSQALEVSEWMNEKDICKFSSIEHAVQLDLIGRVRGFSAAESYFSSLQEHDRNDKTYGALLNCYVRQRQTDKSLSHLEKMKEMGFASSPLTYNDIMCLYTNTNQHQKVPEVLAEMKKNHVFPDNYSYRICISSFGVKSDIDGMEKMMKEMETQSHIAVDWNTYAVAANFYSKVGLVDKAIEALEKAEVRLEKKDGTGFNFLISVYAKLGKRDQVLRLWELEKIACKRCINRDYINVLESLVKLGELGDAMKVVKEWESSGNCYDFRIPNVVIMGYCEKALFEEAEAMLDALTKNKKQSSPNSWGAVALGYLDKGQMRKAFECMKTALSLHMETKGWKPSFWSVMGLLSWVGDQGSATEAESFVESIKTLVPVNREMYHALLRAYVKSGKDVQGLLSKMRADKLDEDEATKKILKVKQTKS
ncbi:hypothetical protein V2J09_009916 [Rumex salicifolius]